MPATTPAKGLRKALAVAASAVLVLTASGAALAATPAAPAAPHAIAVRFFVAGEASNLDVVFQNQFEHVRSFADGTFIQVPYKSGVAFRPVAVYAPGGSVSCTLSVFMSDGVMRQLVTKSTADGVCSASARPLDSSGSRWSVLWTPGHTVR